MRLNKYLASCEVSSRRACEELIKAGRVRINGKVVTELSTQIDVLIDKVEVDGNLVRPTREKKYIVINKPKGYVTTVHDTHNRPTVMDLLPLETRLFPVGRLDLDTEGLLLVTNDGDLTYKLLHPKFKVQKTYLVKIDRPARTGILKRLERGVLLEDGSTAPCSIQILNKNDIKYGQYLKVALYEGRKRQIKRMFRTLGFKVLELRRIEFGPLTLKNLPVGSWRYLTKQEVQALNALIE